jgi:hypothetical protein
MNMPCRCDGYEISEAQQKNETIKSLRNELDRLTQFCCYLSGVVEQYTDNLVAINRADLIQQLDDRYKDWLIKHNIDDIKRTLLSVQANYKQFYDGIISDEEIRERCRDDFIQQAIIVHPLSNWHRTVYFDRIWNSDLFKNFCKKYKDTYTKNKANAKNKAREQIKELQKQIEELSKILD